MRLHKANIESVYIGNNEIFCLCDNDKVYSTNLKEIHYHSDSNYIEMHIGAHDVYLTDETAEKLGFIFLGK